MSVSQEFGRTIQLFLVDGSPNDLMVVSLHGWTGSLLVSRQSRFDRLLQRPEMEKTGVYILYGQDPDNPLKMRAYIGEADSLKDRLPTSARDRGFWETAVAITTSDDALTKGHVQYLEARLIEMAASAARATLENSKYPSPDKRRLPEADKANMEAFLANLKTVLPVVGIDFLKQRTTQAVAAKNQQAAAEHCVPQKTTFEIRHRSGVSAKAVEEDGEFVVLEGSEALKDTGYVQHSYKELKDDLVSQNILKANAGGDRYQFTTSFAFRSPSAAAAVVLDRNTNGRTTWKVEGRKLTYHDWQSLDHASSSKEAAE
ncbi:GIY-YIG nuclease family protein [Nitratireductor rhodophyticola]|uniref:GIY-YIG nuclease family protein n=1 Tax=Nitratireductor rhodophyticola TaxID=2854036 RepID=UPI00300BB89C